MTYSSMAPPEFEYVDRIIAEHAGKPGALLSILEHIQERSPQKYLAPEVLDYLATRAEMPRARLYSVASFYALFNLEPQGKNTICICRGTACHTRGSRSLLQRLMLEMNMTPKEVDGEGADKVSLTTPDGRFTLRTVACFGQCALAPVVEVNHNVYGHMNEQTLQREVEALRGGH